jgi:hypothetical protein
VLPLLLPTLLMKEHESRTIFTYRRSHDQAVNGGFKLNPESFFFPPQVAFSITFNFCQLP